MDYFEMRDRLARENALLRPKLVTVETVVEEPTIRTEKAFVVEGSNQKLYVTGRVTDLRESAAGFRPFTRVSGRYVGAEKANGNGAFWSVGDLEFGQPSVVGGPANLLHNENQIVGCITNAKLVTDSAQFGPHLQTDTTLWKYLFPNIISQIERESAANNLWYSMECISEKVNCVDGCGESFDYGNFMKNKASACEHLAKGGVRRLENPTFLGVGLIFGGVKPGWDNANAEVMREAARLSEEAEGFRRDEAEMIIQNILNWANA